MVRREGSGKGGKGSMTLAIASIFFAWNMWDGKGRERKVIIAMKNIMIIWNLKGGEEREKGKHACCLNW